MVLAIPEVEIALLALAEVGSTADEEVTEIGPPDEEEVVAVEEVPEEAPFAATNPMRF